jgi:hypothetical protein
MIGKEVESAAPRRQAKAYRTIGNWQSTNRQCFGARGEIRTHTKLILSQPPLPIGLHALEAGMKDEG